MRKIFITDIHGQYTKFQNLLKSVDYDSANDTLILGGDYFDRGPENHLMAKWLIDNFRKPNVHLILGNHDLTLRELFNTDWGNFSEAEAAHVSIEFNTKRNGFDATIRDLAPHAHKDIPYRQLASEILENYPGLDEVINGLENYVVIDNHMFFHAGLPRELESATEKDWIHAVWSPTLNDMMASNREWKLLKNKIESYDSVNMGHVSSLYIEDQVRITVNQPINIEGVVFCDGSMGYGLDGFVRVIK